MTRAVEIKDEALKSASRQWWSAHSQDYLPAGAMTHQGVPEDMSDTEFLSYLDINDRNFALNCYFMQARGAPLASALIPTEWIKGKSVLEIGCGLGGHAEALARSGARVTTVDLSPQSVAVTRRRFELKGLKARILEADAECLPFANGEFDYVWSWGVIHHSPDTKACADQITRVLKPSGKLSIMLYHRNSFYNWANVILRYGVLKGQILKHSMQELHNMHTDGKHLGGAPLSKYYTRRQVRQVLFPEIDFYRQRAFDQKQWISNFFPPARRRAVEQGIPDELFTWLFSGVGFLLFSEGAKRS